MLTIKKCNNVKIHRKISNKKFSADQTSNETEFHSFGAATLNARSPNETVFVLGAFSHNCS